MFRLDMESRNRTASPFSPGAFQSSHGALTPSAGQMTGRRAAKSDEKMMIVARMYRDAQRNQDTVTLIWSAILTKSASKVDISL